MKKILLLFAAAVFAAALCGCGGKTYEVSITVPAGSTADFVYSDEEICSAGDKLILSVGGGTADTSVMLKPASGADGSDGTAVYITGGMPAELKAEKGVWYKIGAAAQNFSDEPITFTFTVRGAENIRIE